MSGASDVVSGRSVNGVADRGITVEGVDGVEAVTEGGEAGDTMEHFKG